jgi:8-oxo-dGTP pyrophosphatase MutT (NUDIX family)
MSKDKKRTCGILIKCGKRYLIVHESNEWAPLLSEDDNWGIPKGARDEDDGGDKEAAIRETFEETGIDLKNKRDFVKKLVEYPSKKNDKVYVIFSYEDSSMELMNHKFYCKTEKSINGVLSPEIDSYYWATKKEVEKYLSDAHKGKLFKKKESK